jgi:formate dehydrogenase subunit gamma
MRLFKSMIRRILLVVFLLLGLPAGIVSLEAHEGEAHGPAHHGPDSAKRVNPRAAYWRQVREGASGYTAVRGPEAGVLIQNGGQNWRQIRNGPLAAYGGGLLGFAVLALGAFYLWRGKVRLVHPRTGETLERWTLFERVLHWYTASLFVLLALTGLGLLYGRALLIPLIGREALAAGLDLGKTVHNLVGPPFIAGLVLMILIWAKDNWPSRVDIAWFKALGGLVGDRHPSAGRMNGGEKAWFWLLALGGLAIGVSGLLLDFPNFGQERLALQFAHLIHAGFALLLMAGALGHIYIGSIGSEGALEGMTTGRVDKSWAIQHHDLWAADRERAAPEPPDASEASNPAA